nr:hypothetical protein [Tanacetum cinerariifolium]
MIVTCQTNIRSIWNKIGVATCVYIIWNERTFKNGRRDEDTIIRIVKEEIKSSRGIPVGPKIGFKPRQEYRLVPKKITASSSGDKKKGEEPAIEVSNSNPFEVLNSVDNDEELVIDGQTILVDKAGNPLKKVVYPCDHNSEDEVASVDNDMARDLAYERIGFGTQSLLEQWRYSYGKGDYDEDPYDEDMYEGQYLSEEIHTICDKLDIRVRGRKKQ